MRTVLIVTAAALSLGACSTAIEAVRGPELAPIGYPAALMPTSQAYLPSPEQQHADRAASATGSAMNCHGTSLAEVRGLPFPP